MMIVKTVEHVTVVTNALVHQDIRAITVKISSVFVTMTKLVTVMANA